MPALKLVNINDISREEWLQWRRKGIGSSDAAACAGESKWKSPYALWLEKTGQMEPDEPGESAYWGITLEEVVAQEFMKRTGLKAQRVNSILQHPEYPWMIANIDRRIVGQKVGLECKTTSEYLKDEWTDDKVPTPYLLQCQHCMAVTGYKEWWIAVLVGGNKFYYKSIPRDEDLIQALIKIEADFWNLVETKTQPPLDGSESSTEILGMLYPEGDGSRIDLYDDSLFKQLRDAQAAKKAAEANEEALRNQIKALMTTCEAAFYDGRLMATWKNQQDNRIDTGRLKTERPDIYKAYLNSKTIRKFLPKLKEVAL